MIFSHSVLSGTLVSSYAFDVKSERINDGSLKMVLAIEKIVRDSKSNSLFIGERAASSSHTELEPSELLSHLLKFMSNQTILSLVINSNNGEENTKFLNHLFIVDSYDSFRY